METPFGFRERFGKAPGKGYREGNGEDNNEKGGAENDETAGTGPALTTCDSQPQRYSSTGYPTRRRSHQSFQRRHMDYTRPVGKLAGLARRPILG
jgi:hypothetical protein